MRRLLSIASRKKAKARDKAVYLIHSNGDAVNASMVERARSHLVELPGHGRALAYARDGAVAMFDAMAPQLDGGWSALSTDLGVPEATFDWIFGTVAMPAGELVSAKRGPTIFLNPENHAVAYIRLYVATTVEEYARRLRPSREKRPRGAPPC